jgi:pimeloyl-ACP methyl ester carboxylesterase
VRVEDHTTELGGSPVFYRSAAADGTPPVYLHGIPTSSDDWAPFLERTGGIAVDLPGFGRSGKGGHLKYSADGHAAAVAALLDHLGIGTVQLVAHDWGAAVALRLAERETARVERLVLINPFLGLASLARLWRRPVIGELAMGAMPKFMLARELRKGGPWPDERIDAIWEQFDQGTQRAILRLCRGDGAERRLVDAPPGSTVLVGEQDPWRPEPPAWSSAQRLTNAGHWPWLDDPGVVEQVADWLEQA